MPVGVGVGNVSTVALYQGLRGIFQKAYRSVDVSGNLARICTRIDSIGDSESYPWLGQSPKVREFIGERQAKTLANHQYTLKNKTWESTIGVLRNDLEDHRLGQVRLRVQEMAVDAVEFREELLAQVLEANGTCYDGQAYFSATHPVGGGATQSNLVTSQALSAAGLKAARLAIATYKDSEGRPLNLTADFLLVPPALADTAAELLESDYRPDASTGTGGMAGSLVKNIAKGKMTYGVNGYLSSATSWYVFCTTRPVKPLIFQERTGVEFTAQEKDSESGFMRDMYYYGTRQRCNIGYGMWQMAYKSSA